MRIAVASLAEGLRRAARSWGLGVLLLLVNLGTALLLALPLLATLAAALDERPAGAAMMRGFDYPWWSHWADTRSGWQSSVGPELLGPGFAFKNLDLLLRGQLPAGLFAMRDGDAERAPGLDPLLLGIAAAYMLAQVFLAGGVLAVLRQTGARWTVRAFLHGAGFYLGRFLRVWALMMLAMAVLFVCAAPVTHWVEGRARESVSESSAMAWLLARHAAMLLARAFLHVVGTYARVIVVLEERSSAALAVLSALAFALRRIVPTIVVVAGVALAGLAVLALWLAFDRAWLATGFRTQVVTLLVMQAVVFARILVRIALAGALMDLYRRHAVETVPVALAA